MISSPGPHCHLSGGSLVAISTPFFSCGRVFCRGGHLFALKSEIDSLAYLIHGWSQVKTRKWISLEPLEIFHSILFNIPLHQSHYRKEIFDYLKTTWVCITDNKGNLFGQSTTYFAQDIVTFESDELPSYGLELAREKTALNEWPAIAEFKRIRYLSGLDEDDSNNEFDFSQDTMFDLNCVSHIL